jgi:hypothetical protein
MIMVIQYNDLLNFGLCVGLIGPGFRASRRIWRLALNAPTSGGEAEPAHFNIPPNVTTRFVIMLISRKYIFRNGATRIPLKLSER